MRWQRPRHLVCRAALLLLLAGCGSRVVHPPDQGYRTAVLTFRRGSLAESLQQARAAKRRWQPGSPEYQELRLLEAEILFYQGSKEAGRILAEPPPPREPVAITARRHMLDSLVGGKPKAERSRLLEDAWREAAPASDPGLRLEIQILRARLQSAEDAEGARALFVDARKQAARSGDPYHEAMALNDLGMMSLRGSRFDEAIQWFEQAVAPASKAEAQVLLVAALNNLATCEAELGDFDRAVARRREALDRFGPGEVKAMRRNQVGQMGRFYSMQGDQRKAIEFFRQAVALARELGGGDQLRVWLNNLVTAQIGAGDWDDAANTNREELALSAGKQAVSFARLNTANITEGRGSLEAAIKDYASAIQAGADEPSVLWQAYAGLGRVYERIHKDKPARASFEKALAVIEENQSRLSSDQYKISFLSRLINFHQDYVEYLMRAGEWKRALEVADSSRARILAERLKFENAGRRFRTADFQSYARRTHRVLLSYWMGRRESIGWVVGADAIHYFRLPPADEIRALVEQYQGFVEKGIRDPMTTDYQPGRRLYEILIQPAAEFIPTGAQVVLLPDGPLHRLNFETLRVPGDKPRYWIEDVTLSIAPSLGLLMAQDPAETGQPASVLVFGDAMYTGGTYQPLRYSAVEIAKIRSHFPAAAKTILTGQDANPQAWRQVKPAGFSLIHFSAHAEANPESPLDSAIVLSPRNAVFKLYARDIMTTPLRAGLVTISSCRSAGARPYAGEGLVGLAWAFLRSGSRNVIAGLWDVADSSTAEITDTLYREMEAGRTPVEALRAAKLALIRSAGAYRKPFYWGAFQVYGR
jgi:CHAT domain-containing protein/Tfp pilus assembly protein PilF